MDVLAAISAVISLVALFVSWRVARRQTGIQERLAAIEEARRAEEVKARTLARVTASLVYLDEHLLILRNEGQALARGVQVEPEQGPEHSPIIGLEALPVDLQPGQRMTFRVALVLGDEPMLRITVRWTDEAGEHAEPYSLSTL
jgi:hypothetical protein